MAISEDLQYGSGRRRRRISSTAGTTGRAMSDGGDGEGIIFIHNLSHQEQHDSHTPRGSERQRNMEESSSSSSSSRRPRRRLHLSRSRNLSSTLLLAATAILTISLFPRQTLASPHPQPSPTAIADFVSQTCRADIERDCGDSGCCALTSFCNTVTSKFHIGAVEQTRTTLTCESETRKKLITLTVTGELTSTNRNGVVTTRRVTSTSVSTEEPPPLTTETLKQGSPTTGLVASLATTVATGTGLGGGPLTTGEPNEGGNTIDPIPAAGRASGGSGLGKGAVAGTIIGVMLFLGLVIGLIWFFIMKRKKRAGLEQRGGAGEQSEFRFQGYPPEVAYVGGGMGGPPVLPPPVAIPPAGGDAYTAEQWQAQQGGGGGGASGLGWGLGAGAVAGAGAGGIRAVSPDISPVGPAAAGESRYNPTRRSVKYDADGVSIDEADEIEYAGAPGGGGGASGFPRSGHSTVSDRSVGRRY